jgi:hypothetical protein
MNPLRLPSPELMASCIGIGVLIAIAAIVLCALFGETVEERIERLAHEADAEDAAASAHVRTPVHRLADHRHRR